MLGVGVVGELRRARGHGALHDGLLQVVEDLGVVLGQEGHGHAALARSARTSDTMDVV